MPTKTLLIVNMYAGKGAIKNRLPNVVDVFRQNGHEVEVFLTGQKDDARKTAQQKAGSYDLVVAVGGDGTLNEVITGLMQCDAPPSLGYIPTGTTNDFASNFSLQKDALKAAKSIVESAPFACDVGSFNEHYFIYCAAFGAFTSTAYSTPQASKNTWGRLAYLFEGVKQLSAIKPYHMVVRAEDHAIEDDFVYGMVTNSQSIGGFKGLGGKNMQLDDGLFEVCLIKMPKNLLEMQAIISALLKEDKNSKYIYHFLTSELNLISEVEIPWTLDGEFGGSLQKVEIQIHHKAIRFSLCKN